MFRMTAIYFLFGPLVECVQLVLTLDIAHFFT